MLLIFKHTSNQQGIRRTKDKIKAHLLELRLYQDNMRTSLKAQGSILLSNLKYMSYQARPLLVMIVPVILILIQLNFWFAYKSLEPNQKALLKIQLKEEYSPLETDIKIESHPSINIETLPLRIEEEGEITYRLSAKEQGRHTLHISIGQEIITKQIAVTQKPLSRISPRRIQHKFIEQLLYPSEAPLPKSSPVQSVEITYPTNNLNFFGLGIHWLIAFFILSIIFGFSLKGIFRVEI